LASLRRGRRRGRPRGALRFAPGTQRIIGLTIVNAKWLLERDAQLTVTIPEQVHASAENLPPALLAS
jgi:hypothetical protein